MSPPTSTSAEHPLDRTLRLMADRDERERLRPSELIRQVAALHEEGALPDLVSGRRLDQLRTIGRRLVRQGRQAAVVDLLDPVIAGWLPAPESGLQALLAHARTSLTGSAPGGLEQVVAGTLRGADRALAAGDTRLAADLAVIGAGLLLHPGLHADVASSRLADDTAAYLAPFRESATMRALAAARPPAPGGRPRRPGPRRVVVLPGAYPRFAQPLVAALHARPELSVQVLTLGDSTPSFRWLGTDPELVRARLELGRDQGAARSWPAAFTPPEEARLALAEADVVVADWADKGAVWATLFAPEDARLVIRVHGADTLGLWVHVMDWSRVDAVVTVSPHHASLLDAVLENRAVPEPPAVPRALAVPNVVALGPPADRPAREPRTLGLVGWGKRVKDPLWAVEVLARLRARESDWRLRLVGHGLLVAPGRDESYARAFSERCSRPDVAGAIDLVPHTDDVAGEVARLGFILSSSLRESFHLGLLEGVLGGAVPVVRDWPFYSAHGGAGALYPAEWVVPDVDAAFGRIWALREEPDRQRAAARATRQVSHRFASDRVTSQLLAVVLGA